MYTYLLYYVFTNEISVRVLLFIAMLIKSNYKFNIRNYIKNKILIGLNNIFTIINFVSYV